MNSINILRTWKNKKMFQVAPTFGNCRRTYPKRSASASPSPTPIHIFNYFYSEDGKINLFFKPQPLASHPYELRFMYMYYISKATIIHLFIHSLWVQNKLNEHKHILIFFSFFPIWFGKKHNLTNVCGVKTNFKSFFNFIRE